MLFKLYLVFIWTLMTIAAICIAAVVGYLIGNSFYTDIR